MRIRLCLAVTILAGVAVAARQEAAAPFKPTRINKAIELLADGQPIYYTQVDVGSTTKVESWRRPGPITSPTTSNTPRST